MAAPLAAKSLILHPSYTMGLTRRRELAGWSSAV
jgi:hypothetical protein